MNYLKTFTNFLKTTTIAVLTFSLTGCVYLVVGGIGALGGYIVSSDSVEGITSNDSLTVWDAATEIISVMGVIEQSNETSGVIISTINGTTVTVTVTSVSDSSTKLNVKARKYYLPRISTAQDIFVKVMTYLNE